MSLFTNTGSNDKFTLIVGMHRSGTSCLTGCLELFGMSTGEGIFRGDPRHEHHPKGTVECQRMVDIHNAILADNKGTWDNPPDKVRFQRVHKALVMDRVEELQEYPNPGVKDPRLILMIDEWMKLVDSRIVGTFRHPVAVARSLYARNEMPQNKAFELWKAYNKHLIALHRRHPFPIVEYDLSDPESYAISVLIAATEIGFRKLPYIEDIMKYAEPQYDRNRCPDKVPRTCRKVFEYLQTHKMRPRQLDFIRERRDGLFHKLKRIFWP